ncbi:uncharacterized protein LOC114282529 [Camellia sinensis]|uniref:uncharacterized protein LOC114282529 n=1 Tax=Camellia sinensis TaxID=4442 RepID=UPI0010368950|nr:uncharacterized protein LOC114282529 [Camellia sinensis]
MSGSLDLRRRDQRCKYHKDHGHTIDKCYALKDHLEELVREHLNDYLPKKAALTKTILRRSPLLGLIHMIYSLPHLNKENMVQLQWTPESSQSSLQSIGQPKRQRLAPINVISFSNADLEGLTLLNDDALLDLKDEDFTAAEYPIFGFNANPEYFLEKIVLLVRAGTQTLEVEFPVVKFPSPYNLIMDRTWLHAMKAILSTYHQLLRFPTQYGIEQIRGSQTSAKSCYMMALGKRPKNLKVNSIEVPDQEGLDNVGKFQPKRR